jgi:hypothetical protein
MPPFVTSLRSRSEVIRLGPPGGPTIRVRVQSADVWDVVQVDAAPSTPVAEVKRAAAAALLSSTDEVEDLVIKLRGFEVLDENSSLTDAGAVDGSIFLLAFRRRRPVR